MASTNLLRGKDLVSVAKRYTNEELRAQANKTADPAYTTNNYTRFLTDAIDEYAIPQGIDPDAFRDDYNLERADKIEERLRKNGVSSRMRTKKTTMPAGIADLSDNPSLAELKTARLACLPHTHGGHRFPSEYWVKLHKAMEGMRDYDMIAKELGFEKPKSGANHLATARSRGLRLAPIVARKAQSSAPASQVSLFGTAEARTRRLVSRFGTAEARKRRRAHLMHKYRDHFIAIAEAEKAAYEQAHPETVAEEARAISRTALSNASRGPFNSRPRPSNPRAGPSTSRPAPSTSGSDNACEELRHALVVRCAELIHEPCSIPTIRYIVNTLLPVRTHGQDAIEVEYFGASYGNREYSYEEASYFMAGNMDE